MNGLPVKSVLKHWPLTMIRWLYHVRRRLFRVLQINWFWTIELTPWQNDAATYTNPDIINTRDLKKSFRESLPLLWAIYAIFKQSKWWSGLIPLRANISNEISNTTYISQSNIELLCSRKGLNSKLSHMDGTTPRCLCQWLQMVYRWHVFLSSDGKIAFAICVTATVSRQARTFIRGFEQTHDIDYDKFILGAVELRTLQKVFFMMPWELWSGIKRRYEYNC